VGNIAAASIDIYPGPYYSNDRFSNGPVYVEALATSLGLPPTVRSTAGGDNFAYGGAKTFGTGGLEGFFIRDVDEQVDQFLASRTVDPNGLFVVFAGSNDIVGGQTDVGMPINSLAEDIGQLIDAGARKFLVPNLPPLGYTPRFNTSPSTLATYNSRAQQFNSALAVMIDTLEVNNPALTIFRFDLAGLFSEALADPQSFGLTNVTQAAAPGLQPGTGSYNTSQIAPNAHEYLFWDDLHPTATVHAILSQRMLSLFVLPGDFNDDGAVDAADYVVWRQGLGTIYTQDDFDTWRANFGQTAGGRASSNSPASVPEPAAASILLATVAIATLRRKLGVS
jgi:phospholipase/lecithinase/hemolysin